MLESTFPDLSHLNSASNLHWRSRPICVMHDLILPFKTSESKMREHNFCPMFCSVGDMEFPIGLISDSNAQITILMLRGRYTLWDHGQRRTTYSQAKETRNATENRNERIKQGLIFQITQAYYDVLKTQELVKVSKEILARSQENTAATRVHVQVGNLIPADIATSQVREANDELSLLSNENALKVAMATLPRLMGMKPGTVVILAEDADYAQYRDRGEIEVTEMAVEEAIQLAYENRPEFKELNSLLAQREADMKLAKLGRLPQLDADFNYAVNLDDYLHEREDFNQFRSWDFTTRLNFPIFDGGVTKRRVQEVDLLLNQTREDAQDWNALSHWRPGKHTLTSSVRNGH